MSSLMADPASTTGMLAVDEEADVDAFGGLATTMPSRHIAVPATMTKAFVFSNQMSARSMANTVAAATVGWISTRSEIELSDVVVVDASTVLHSQSQWKPYVYRRLVEMQLRRVAFEPAEYPSEETLWRAWHLINSILDSDTPTPSVVPGDEGGVRLVWHKGDWDTELEIEANDVFVWARNHRTGETWHGGLGDAHRRLPEHLRSIS